MVLRMKKDLHVMRRVHHHDNNIHNYEWKFFKKDEPVSEEWVNPVKVYGDFMYCEPVLAGEITPENAETHIFMAKQQEEPKEEVKEVKFTKAGLKALKKDEQVKMLKELGVTKPIRFEKNRVKKLAELLGVDE